MKNVILCIMLAGFFFLSAKCIAEPLYDPATGILSLSSVSTSDRAFTFRDIDINLKADGYYEIVGGWRAEANVLYVDELLSVYDGDTFKVNINHLHPLIGRNIRIRTYGIDAPEMDGKCEYENRLARLAQRLAESTLSNAGEIKLTDVKRDNYFRIGAVVYVDGISFNDIMLNAGLAVPYDSRNRMDWCN